MAAKGKSKEEIEARVAFLRSRPNLWSDWQTAVIELKRARLLARRTHGYGVVAMVEMLRQEAFLRLHPELWHDWRLAKSELQKAGLLTPAMNQGAVFPILETLKREGESQPTEAIACTAPSEA